MKKEAGTNPEAIGTAKAEAGQVRLRTNLIVDARFYARDSVVDLALIPEHLRDETHIAFDPKDCGNQVLALHDIAFMSAPTKGATGVPTSYPVHIMAGELLELARVPPSHRESLKEGSDYAVKWTREEQQRLQKAAKDAYAKELEPAVQPSSLK